MNYSVVIVAAGKSTRFESDINKLLYVLPDGSTVIEKTISIFAQDEDCKQQIVVSCEDVAVYLGADPNYGKELFCAGGSSRQESVLNGLLAVTQPYVLIHDGARCYLEKEDLENLKKNITMKQGAILVKSSVDTIKVVKDGFIEETLDRDNIKRAQTPQGFPAEEAIRCYRKALKDGFVATDDAQIMEKYSKLKIKAVESVGHNTKVTTMDDIRGETTCIRKEEKN